MTSAKMSRFSRRRDYKAFHLKKSLQPRRHHARVEIRRDLRYKSKRNAIRHDNHIGTVNDIKVSHTSKFARKGITRRKRVAKRR